jgi:hypothetical protein
MPTHDEYLLGGLLERDAHHAPTAKRLHQNIEAFLLAGGTDRLEGDLHKKIAEIAVKYHKQTDDFLDLDALQNILRGKGATDEDLTAAAFVFSAALDLDVPSPKFRFWLQQAKEQDTAIALADILEQSSQILEGRVKDETSGIIYQGAVDAASFLLDKVSTVVQVQTLGTQPGGDIRKERQAILEEVDRAERGLDVGGRLLTGYNFIDSPTNGLDLTDFLLVGAHTGEGKSQLCHNIAYNLCIQGFNGLIITAETARAKYRRRILCRHTHSTKAGGVIGGIPYNNIKTGRWDSDDQRQTYVRIVQDWTENPTYGVCDVTQVSAGATMNDVRAQCYNFLRAYNAPLHYVVVDYLALFSAIRARPNRRDELVEILQQNKELCVTFDHGAGFLGISAHQTKQERREEIKPELGKFYTIRDYSDTSEAGKSIDVGVMLLRTEELKKLHEVAVGLVKNRDGETPAEISRLYEDYASSFLGNIILASP